MLLACHALLCPPPRTHKKQLVMSDTDVCAPTLLPADDFDLAAKGHTKLDSHVAQTTQAHLQQD
jgi:hypothetical protein